jgi:hypothetical protein
VVTPQPCGAWSSRDFRSLDSSGEGGYRDEKGELMFRRRVVMLCALVLVLSGPAGAQTFHVVNLDPSLVLFDINSDLAGVGVQRGDSFTPFLYRPSGTQLFPQFAGLMPLRINNAGVVVGLKPGAVVFRAGSQGSGFAEIAVEANQMPGVLALTEGGLALLFTSVRGRIANVFTGYFLWDGLDVVSVVSAYDLPGSARVVTVGEDGTIGGAVDGMPFLKRRGAPLSRPWSGSGTVSAIGSSGHVVGIEGADTVILKKPDGTVRRYAGLHNAIVHGVNSSGDFVGVFDNVARSRTEGFLVRNEQLVSLDASFGSPDEYVGSAHDISDSGAIVAHVGPHFGRYVLMVPALPAPAGVAVTVVGRFVSVTWQPVTGATDYIVEAGSLPGSSDFFNSAVGPALSVGGTVPPGRYYVRVRARSGTAVSAPSSEVVVDVGAETTLPAAPAGLRWTDYTFHGSSLWRLDWLPVDNALEYFLAAGSAPGLSDLYDGPVGVVTTLWRGLAPGRYYVRVRARNAGGFGPFSEEVELAVQPWPFPPW